MSMWTLYGWLVGAIVGAIVGLMGLVGFYPCIRDVKADGIGPTAMATVFIALGIPLAIVSVRQLWILW